MESLLQGTIVTIHNHEFTIRTALEIEQAVCVTAKTVNNGWPKVGDHVLIQVNDQQQALVMTRYWCAHSHAA